MFGIRLSSLNKKEVAETRKQRNTRQYSDTGKRIVKGLIDRDMTAVQLAAAVGTRPQYLNDIIHGRRSGRKYMDEIMRILEL
jgi:hypothetical protein